MTRLGIALLAAACLAGCSGGLLGSRASPPNLQTVPCPPIAPVVDCDEWDEANWGNWTRFSFWGDRSGLPDSVGELQVEYLKQRIAGNCYRALSEAWNKTWLECSNRADRPFLQRIID